MELQNSDSSTLLRRHLLEFLINSSQQLLVRPIVKYTALSFFADRFLPSISRSRQGDLFDEARCDGSCWLFRPLAESNLQVFALVSIWVSSKLHETQPLSVKSLKSLGDMVISDQCFTTRDFAMAESAFLEVMQFDIGASQVAFIFLEELLVQFRELSKVGNLVSLEVCMEIMDLLYETEQTSMLFSSPHALSASILVAAYFFMVPKQQWEFPLLPWGFYHLDGYFQRQGLKEGDNRKILHIY
ncbi:cyclin-J18-like isoform X2 [Phalaenopsis equestris]|uniref:cyclin-J18-like isoform X2 n=1 Tax=Phalaenopsis equestris TaxID=78828 RepID=UPI0009E64FD3|nr:cyclin-J18-like isoform X2 [Phalaenopsis equestris]